jgi:hypothetical protein
MRCRSLLALSAGAALTAACASSSRQAGDSSPAPASVPTPAATPATTPTENPAPAAQGGGSMWQGDLRPENGGSLAGNVMLMPASTAGQTTATINLSGAPANGTHPWHVHSGTCAQKGPSVGPPTAYTPITVDSAGAAKLDATLPFASPTSGSYSVNIHKSLTEMGMIVGCADLKMGA